jgi:hypothetical protein
MADAYWDGQAATFDDAPDHGLRDPAVRAAWSDLPARLLRPDSRLVVIEGRWSTGSGMSAFECRGRVLQHRGEARVERLDDPALWGRPIDDERYAVLSRS